MSDFRARTISAVSWAVVSKISTQLISFGFGIVLARLLVPDDFGLIAMTMVFIGLADIFMFGLGEALIQKKDVNESHYSTVFWFNLALAFIVTLLIYVLSPGIATFYARPEIEEITKLLSVTFFIRAISSVPRIRLVKKLNYKYQSIADFVAMLVSGVIAIILAVNGYGYWALAIHILFKAAFSSILIWTISRWYPRSGFNVGSFSELFGFSAGVFGTKAIRYMANSFDKLLLGKYIGAGPVGLYEKAHSLMLFPLQNISYVLGNVMFSSLSIIQSDKDRVKNIYLRMIRAIAFFTFPMMMGMFVVAESFTYGVLGSHWGDMVPLFQLFCVAGIITSISSVTGSLYLSQGASFLEFRVVIVMVSIRLIGIVVGLQWGALGVAISFVIAAYINTVIGLYFAGKLIGLRLYEVFIAVAPILFPSLLMAAIVWGVKYIVDLDSELLLFITQVVLGMIVYLIAVVIMKLEIFYDIVSVLRTHLQKRTHES